MKYEDMSDIGMLVKYLLKRISGLIVQKKNVNMPFSIKYVSTLRESRIVTLHKRYNYENIPMQYIEFSEAVKIKKMCVDIFGCFLVLLKTLIVGAR